jgi:hypothetical protein
MPRPFRSAVRANTSFAVRFAAPLSAMLVVALEGAPAQAQSTGATRTVPPATPVVAPDVYRSLPWRFIGPEGNRFTSAAGIPGDPSTYYVGAASGGIYKTTDGGVNWSAIFGSAGAVHRLARRGEE